MIEDFLSLRHGQSKQRRRTGAELDKGSRCSDVAGTSGVATETSLVVCYDGSRSTRPYF